MSRPPQLREAKLTRSRHAGRTLCFTTPHLPKPKSRRCRLTFIKPEHVPEFEGEEAWFELELVEAKPWNYWRALRPIEPPAWAEPRPWKTWSEAGS